MGLDSLVGPVPGVPVASREILVSCLWTLTPGHPHLSLDLPIMKAGPELDKGSGFESIVLSSIEA